MVAFLESVQLVLETHRDRKWGPLGTHMPRPRRPEDVLELPLYVMAVHRLMVAMLIYLEWKGCGRNMEKIEAKSGRLHVGVVGIPFSRGQPREGTEMAPSYLRKGQIISRIERLGNKVTDHGDLSLEDVKNDLPWHNKVKFPRTVGYANKKIAETVAKISQTHQATLVLGGDHSTGVGSIIGHAQTKPDLVVLWVDAHADLNTPQSSTSGNLHGMPLAFVVKEMKDCTSPLPGFEWVKPCVSARDLVYIGLRDVDEAERAYLDTFGIQSYSMQEVDRYGIENVLDRALKSVDPSGRRPIHVSFDVDALDPMYTPSTGTPVPGGLTRRESLFLAEEIARTGRLSVLDVMEVNPALGSEQQRNMTLETTVEVVAHFFGKRREGNVTERFCPTALQVLPSA